MEEYKAVVFEDELEYRDMSILRALLANHDANFDVGTDFNDI